MEQKWLHLGNVVLHYSARVWSLLTRVVPMGMVEIIKMESLVLKYVPDWIFFGTCNRKSPLRIGFMLVHFNCGCGLCHIK